MVEVTTNNIHNEIEECLAFLINSTVAYSVNETGYVTTLDGGPVTIKDGGMERHIVLYKEVIVDKGNALILNPLAEGTSSSRDKDWFYEVMVAGTIYKFIDVFNFILDQSKEEKTSTKVSKFIAPYVDLIKDTDKMKKDIEKITAVYNNFASVFYNASNKVAKFRCMLFEDESKRAKYSGITKNTWKFLEKVATDILSATNKDNPLYKYESVSKSIGYPKFESTMNVYYELYKQLNPVFELMDETMDSPITYAIDLDKFKGYLSRLPEYFKVAKNVVQKAPDTTVNTSVPQPAVASYGIPTPAGQMSIPSPFGSYGNPGYSLPQVSIPAPVPSFTQGPVVVSTTVTAPSVTPMATPAPMPVMPQMPMPVQSPGYFNGSIPAPQPLF